MEHKDNKIAVPTKQMELAQVLNQKVTSVIRPNDGLEGFEKSFLISNAIGELKSLLTSEYMKPIMAMQGNKLGFKTDKDDKGGYSEEVVKNCLIEAVLTGVLCHSNMFNIIAGNCYITKEGFGYLLSRIPGLKYKMIPALPRVNADKSGAAVLFKISWTLNGVTQTEEIDLPIKMNQYASTDSVLGKATRKARAWLFATITGTEVGEGDVQDVDSQVVQSKTTTIDKDEERIALLIENAKTLDELRAIEKHVPDNLLDAYTVKMDSLKAAR